MRRRERRRRRREGELGETRIKINDLPRAVIPVIAKLEAMASWSLLPACLKWISLAWCLGGAFGVSLGCHGVPWGTFGVKWGCLRSVMEMPLACLVTCIECLGRESLRCRVGALWCHWDGLGVEWGGLEVP